MGGIVFLWILLVVVAFVNHQDTLVAWVLGATFVLGVIGAMMNASSEEKEALERVKREKQNLDIMQPSPGGSSVPEAYQAARETMGQRLHYLELKYPLNLNKERVRNLDNIECMLQRAESWWERGRPSVELHTFFRYVTNINALRMWMSKEDETAYRVDAKNMLTLWKQQATLRANESQAYQVPEYHTGKEYDSE